MLTCARQPAQVRTRSEDKEQLRQVTRVGRVAKVSSRNHQGRGTCEKGWEMEGKV